MLAGCKYTKQIQMNTSSLIESVATNGGWKTRLESTLEDWIWEPLTFFK